MCEIKRHVTSPFDFLTDLDEFALSTRETLLRS